MMSVSKSADQATFATDFSNHRFVMVPGHFDFFGGAERQSLLLAHSLKERFGCHVDFLGWGGDGILAEEVRKIGCTPTVFPLDVHQRGISFMRKLWKLARFIRKDMRPDYLLPFVGTHCKIIGSIWKQTGARFCWWNQRDEGRMIFGTRTEQKLLDTLPAVVSNSWEGRDFLVNRFQLSRERVRVINNGIVVPNITATGQFRKQYGISSTDVVFAMIANLTRYKDHETLLKAFARVLKHDSSRRYRLVLAGRFGETTEAIKAQAFDLGLNSDCLILTGNLCPSEVQQLLSDVDIVVHSSTKEGCPNGVLEAMAMGKCVLGTNISGLRQALGDEFANAYLSPLGDDADLATRMTQVAESREHRSEIGASNRKRIESDFSVRGMTEAVLETVSQYRIA